MTENGIQFEISRYERFCKKLEQTLQITAITKIAKGETLDSIENQLDAFLDSVAEQQEQDDQEP